MSKTSSLAEDIVFNSDNMLYYGLDIGLFMHNCRISPLRNVRQPDHVTFLLRNEWVSRDLQGGELQE